MAAKTIIINEMRGDLSAYFTRGIAKRPNTNKQFPHAMPIYKPSYRGYIGTHERFITAYPCVIENWRFSCEG